MSERCATAIRSGTPPTRTRASRRGSPPGPAKSSILGSSAHIIFTLRAKVDWVVQENERGKKEPVKVGLAPVQREGVDYEADLFFTMTAPDNLLIVEKSRCDRLGMVALSACHCSFAYRTAQST